MNINTTEELRKSIDDGKYAFPGGYPKFYITKDCSALCHDCVQNNLMEVTHVDINNEQLLHCNYS